MVNPMRGIWQFTSGPNRKFLGTFLLLLLIAGIPLTVFVAQQQQDLRQRANTLTCYRDVTDRTCANEADCATAPTTCLNGTPPAGRTWIRLADPEADSSSGSAQASSSLLAATNGVIQGRRVDGPSGVGTTITIKNSSNQVVGTYTITQNTTSGALHTYAKDQLVPGQTYTISVATPANYTAYYSTCMNCTNHPESSYQRGEQTTVTIPTTNATGATFAYADVYWKFLSTIPNCSNLSGPTTVTVGQTATYSATFTSAQGQLSGTIDAMAPNDTTPKTSWVWSHPARAYPGTSKTDSFTWTPTTAGTHTVFCRAWNDGIAECRGEAATVDSTIRQHTCAGPTSKLTVTVSSASATPVNCDVATQNWRIDSVVPTYANGNAGLTINGNFPQIAHCGRRAVNGAGHSLVYAFKGTYGTEEKSYYAYQPAQVISIAENKIVLGSIHPYTNATNWKLWTMYCTGSALNGQCTGWNKKEATFTIQNPASGTTYTVSGTVFDDTNKNGIKDTGEVGISGATVQVKYQYKAGSWNATTNANGVYTISGREQENYVASITVLPGNQLTTPNNVYVSLTQNRVVNFGVAQLTAPGSYTLSGTVFVDANRNRVKDATETGYANGAVNLKYFYRTDGNWNATTNTTGAYSFANVAQENYKVTLTVPTGYEVTTATVSGMIDVNQNRTFNFGIAPVVTAGVTPPATRFAMNLILHGIGIGGDNVTPTSGGNKTPTRLQHGVTIEVYNAADTLVLTKTGTLAYQPVPATGTPTGTQGKFIGTIDMGTTLATGNYTIRVKPGRYLRKRMAGIVRVNAGTTVTLPETSFVAGDINNDNRLNILDYSAIMGCYNVTAPTARCTDQLKRATDINDDSRVNQYDYNLFLRELSVQAGE